MATYETYGLNDDYDEEQESFLKYTEKTPIVQSFEMGNDDSHRERHEKSGKPNKVLVVTPLRVALFAVFVIALVTIIARHVSSGVASKSANAIIDSKSNTFRFSPLPYYIRLALFEIFKMKYNIKVNCQFWSCDLFAR